MRDDVQIAAVVTVDDSLAASLATLVRQLSSSATVPTLAELREIVSSPCTELFIARDSADGGHVLGALTLATFRIPTGIRAWIEDVVVDADARGRGVGEALTRSALRLAEERGARTVELTSRPDREAANRLYKKLGFVARETNVYRYTFGSRC